MKDVINHIKGIWDNSSWYAGCGFYRGKPMIGIFTTYYDGSHIVAHLGPFWLSVTYVPIG